MNRLTTEKRAQILGMMVEGMSIRSISRLTGASKNTVVKLLADAGAACSDYQDRALRELPCKRLQLDEIWSFVYAKARNVRTAKSAPEIAGDVWTWTAIDADTKLVMTIRFICIDKINPEEFKDVFYTGKYFGVITILVDIKGIVAGHEIPFEFIEHGDLV
jgi:hypothetical protein